MRQGNQIDLRTQGGSRSSGALATGGSVQYIFDPQQSRVGASSGKPGLWNMVRGIMIQAVMIVVRSSGGTTPIYADQFPRAIKSVSLQGSMFGTIYDPTIIDGMVAKHIIEYFGLGYQRAGINRQPIPGTDGTYTRTLELFLPFAQLGNIEPDHWDIWLGWLNDYILELFVNDAAQPFGISGVTITSVTFNAAIETVPWPELIIPPLVAHRNYKQAASAASNGPKLVNAGDAGPLYGVADGARLDAMLFAHQSGGFTGPGTADQITAISMPWRDQQQSTLPQFFFERFLKTAKRNKFGFTSSVVDVYDNSEPYPMVANPGTGALNDASAFYTPLVWQEGDSSLITYMQKFKGNYPLDGMTFSAAQSGSFNVYTREVKEFSTAKCSEMLSAAGINPERVVLVPKTAKKNIKPISRDKAFCLPRGIVQKKVA